MPWKDLRREVRRPYFEPVLLRWEEGRSTFSVRGSCLNLSNNGLAVETFEPLPERVEVQCVVLSLNLALSGTVRHRHRRMFKQVAGLEFDEPLDIDSPRPQFIS
jgi:hypothetical protein